MTEIAPGPRLPIDECRKAGAAFGVANCALDRRTFSERLLRRLLALESLFGGIAAIGEDGLAAFDRAARDAWAHCSQNRVEIR
jgi:hypothetical protein